MLEEKWREGIMTIALAEKIVHLLRKNLYEERVQLLFRLILTHYKYNDILDNTVVQ